MTLRFARFALSIALLLTLFFALSLPLPPHTMAERATEVVLLLALFAEIVALVRLPRRSAVTRGLTYLLGAYGAVILGRWALLLVQGLGAVPAASALLACVQAVALIAAAIAVFRDQAEASAARSTA